MPTLLKVEDLAVTLAVHRHTINRALNGQIKMKVPPAFKLGGRWRFRADDVRAFIDEISGRPPVPASLPEAEQLAQKPIKRKPGRPRAANRCDGGAA